ncbi:cystatin-12-like isoform X1 [Ochotona curzoniae]|uniref:cystatin-12-like isoform X1 n=1 Tax=Ochotona curzoniae TaxID=130825 RepID=UPI001B353CD2|nr:cystatin-12-like isoform X1 [Ochotona curzoniae]
MEVSALGWRSAAQGISRQNCAGLQLPRVLLSPLSHMSPAPRAAMPHKALLFVGFVLMGSLVGSFKFMDNSKFVDIDKNSEFFAISMEYVMYKFNEAQEDEFAYKFLKVRQSQRKMFSWTCLVDVEMGRTICKKHDEDIDNCPLQEGAGEKQVRCTYILTSLVWFTQFTILDSSCVLTSERGVPVASPSSNPVPSRV